VSGERRGWNRGWDVKATALGLFLVGAGVVLARRDDAAFDALPELLVVGVVACVALALVLGPLEGQIGDAVAKERTRLRAKRRGADVIRH
jgi:hypothetical protein